MSERAIASGWAAAPVLVVDDDRNVRESVAELLEAAGYRVEQARDGMEALDTLYRGVKPSFILLDLKMPGMDGETFCAAWRSDERLHAIPVILFSAEGDLKAIADRCRATGFLHKPPSAPELLELALRFMPARGVVSAAQAR
jgi:CheY-like chemotaxis protein